MLQDNHVIWTGHNNTLREAAIQTIFVKMIEAAGLADDRGNTQFMFQIVLDEGKVQALFRSGIQEIDLGLGAFRPTLERIAAGGKLPDEGFIGSIAAMFNGIPSARDLEAAERIEGKLILRPGRAWDQPDVIDLMASISNNIRDEEEFVIVTKSGLRITRDKMSLHQPFEVSGNKRVLASLEVDKAFRDIFEQLDEGGILDA